MQFILSSATIFVINKFEGDGEKIRQRMFRAREEYRIPVIPYYD